MCLILFKYEPDAEHNLIIAANRDEFHSRPTLPAHFWDNESSIFAGKDLLGGGTWLGSNKSGKVAGLTNFSQSTDPYNAQSRGFLVRDFLIQDKTSSDFANLIDPSSYAGFNLLLYDQNELVTCSNISKERDVEIRKLNPGTYALSNTYLTNSWPKCQKGRQRLADRTAQDFSVETLLEILRDSQPPIDNLLPRRGNTIEYERRLGSAFVVGEDYGTRASTVLLVNSSKITFHERSFTRKGLFYRDLRKELPLN